MPLRDNVPISVRLASHREAWQRRCMTEKQPQARQGAGAFIALLTITGAIAGGLAGQPTIGLLAGLGAGIVVAIVMWRSEEHTSELQSLMRISYAVFCLKKKTTQKINTAVITVLPNQ